MKHYGFTDEGRKRINLFIKECEAMRKEILDAGIDTANETTLPTAQDILDDINNGVGVDEENEYYNSWGVTDNYSSDCISLSVGEEIILTE